MPPRSPRKTERPAPPMPSCPTPRAWRGTRSSCSNRPRPDPAAGAVHRPLPGLLRSRPHGTTPRGGPSPPPRRRRRRRRTRFPDEGDGGRSCYCSGEPSPTRAPQVESCGRRDTRKSLRVRGFASSGSALGGITPDEGGEVRGGGAGADSIDCPPSCPVHHVSLQLARRVMSPSLFLSLLLPQHRIEAVEAR